MDRTRLVVTTLTALLVIPTTYSLIRSYDVLFGNEPNPASVSPGVHIAMFWRLSIGSYAALALFPLIYTLVGKHPGLVLHTTSRLLPIVGGFLFFQAIFLP